MNDTLTKYLENLAAEERIYRELAAQLEAASRDLQASIDALVAVRQQLFGDNQ
jgi:hypothetical protein